MTELFPGIEPIIDGRYNESHPLISPINANINLEAGPLHWNFKDWDPQFGDISRYTLLKLIGTGRYSDVYQGLQDNQKVVAIKILRPVNCDRVRREMRILSAVQGHPTILKLMDIVIDPVRKIPSLVTDFCPNGSWKELITTMRPMEVRFYIYRVLQALAHTHNLGIMHRDVKPLNILCSDPREQVILADWGLAEYYHPLRKYSIHVGTRFYKAPELLFEFGYYNYSVDIWSVGCTLVEALSGEIHFFQSDDNEHHIESICYILGGKNVIEWIEKYQIPIGKGQLQRISKMRGIGIEAQFPPNRRNVLDDNAKDLIRKLLTIDHNARITAKDALEHPFFEPVRKYDRDHSI